MSSSKEKSNNKTLQISLNAVPESGDKFDAIVIGTGMGGAACGAILAKHGLKTLVLEKNPRIGGSCSYYEKEGFKVDMGTHMFIRGNKGPFGECTRRLGMGTPLEFRRTRDIAWVRGFNVDAAMPSSYIRMPAFALKVIVQSGLPLRTIPSVARLFLNLLRMKPDDIESWKDKTVEDFIDTYTEDAFIHALIGYLISLFFVLPPWKASAGEAIWNFQHFIRDNNLSYPKGGTVIIPETFLKGAETHGAKVLTNAGVEKILVEDGKVTGVLVTNNRKFFAPVVVSTTSLKDTVFTLAGSEYFPSSYVAQVDSIKGSHIAVQAKIGLKKNVTNAGCICGGYPMKAPRHELTRDSAKESFQLMEEGRIPPKTRIYCPIPSNFDEELAPEGMQLLTACSAAPTTDIELQDPPQAWIDSMLNAIYKMVPNAKENIMFEDTLTVEAIAGWIGKASGSAITTAQIPEQVGKNRPDHRTPVRGLYICGDGAGGMGVGTELACQSGMDCADLINDEWSSYTD